MYKDLLKKHFKEEFKFKNAINQTEKEMETLQFSLTNKNAELSIVKNKKGSENIQVKIINEEIEDVQEKIDTSKASIEKNLQQFNTLKKERDKIQ